MKKSSVSLLTKSPMLNVYLKDEFATNPYFRERSGEMTLPVPPDWNLVQNVLNSPDLENIR